MNHDENNDRTIQSHERRPNVNVTFTPVNGGDPIWTISDMNGDYRILVPFTELSITVEAESYRTTPREDVSILDLPGERIALWDVPLVPNNIPVEGVLFLDENLNGEWDDDEGPAAGVEIIFIAIGGDEFKTTTQGGFHIGIGSRIPPPNA